MFLVTDPLEHRLGFIAVMWIAVLPCALSLLAALLLLAATGPGGLSVDAKYGKGN